jgi:hypothetical protein
MVYRMISSGPYEDSPPPPLLPLPRRPPRPVISPLLPPVADQTRLSQRPMVILVFLVVRLCET